jgi:Ca2+-binding RTX toxin-like protein
MRARISQFLRNRFGKVTPAARAAQSRSANDRPILRLERLDDRIVPTVTVSGNSADLRIDIGAAETVEVGRTDNFKLRVTVDGVDLNIQQAASSIQKLTITATGDFGNSINLLGINPADFVSLTQLTVDAGGGNDSVLGSAFPETLSGGEGKDLINGGGGKDLINGGLGDDLIGGGLGDDVITGGDGNDRLYGDAGNDVIGGGAGGDKIYGGLGSDSVYGGVGNDALYGGAGNDNLHGGLGSDSLTGGVGADSYSGGPGNDIFFLDSSDHVIDF